MLDLSALVNNLRNNSYNLKVTEKQELASLIEKVLTEGEQEIKIAAKNELKSDLENEIKQKVDKFDQLKADLETQKAQILQLTQKNQELGIEKSELNNKVQRLQEENKELEAQRQSTEQLKPGKAMYTAAVGVGFATGLAALTVLDRTVRLDMWVMFGIALASALAVGCITCFALEPGTQVSEIQEPQNTNVRDYCKA